MSDGGFGVSRAIADAARITGVDANYLRATAQRESAFDPNAQAKTSSATGLYQFIERTWLNTLERHGDALGLTPDEGADKQDILAMRFDPKASALMAGALTQDNAKALETELGRAPTSGELYTAHVMGAGDAVTLLRAAEKTPDASAADMFPAPAAANRGLFYDKAGEPVSVSALRDRFAQMIEGAKGQPHAQPQASESVSWERASWSSPDNVPTLRLTPGVTAILASLDAPMRADADAEDGPREEREQESRQS